MLAEKLNSALDLFKTKAPADTRKPGISNFSITRLPGKMDSSVRSSLQL